MKYMAFCQIIQLTTIVHLLNKETKDCWCFFSQKKIMKK